MPRKVFAPLEKLTSSDVNTFLMDQAVMTFDDAAARSASIPSPVQGMVTFLKDSEVLEAWIDNKWTKISGIEEAETEINNLIVRVLTLTTNDIAEGVNLYYTNARADSRIALASIGDLSDVDLTGVEDGETLVYDETLGKWIPGEASGGASLTVDSVSPSNPGEGDLWFNSVLGRTFVYYEDDDSAQWVEIGAGSGPTTAAVLTSAPASAELGQLWFDAETGNMYFYYVDNDSAQWIQVRSAAPTPIELDGLTNVDTSGAQDGDTLVYDGTNWVNGPKSGNAIINGDFGIWQRGTSIALGGGGVVYSSDRWETFRGGFTGNATVSRQNSGLTGFQYSARIQRNSGTSDTQSLTLGQPLESNDSFRFAGKTFTVSFWAKRGADYSNNNFEIAVRVRTGRGTDQTFRAGFSNEAFPVSQTISLTSSWQKFSFTGTAESLTTQIGVEFGVFFSGTAGANDWVEFTGVQLEAGPVATPFTLAGGGSKAAELALCQRYYYRISPTNQFASYGFGQALSTTLAGIFVNFPTEMRVTPTSLEQSGTAGHYAVWRASSVAEALTAVPTFNVANKTNAVLLATTAGNLVAGNATNLIADNTAGFLAWSAEL